MDAYMYDISKDNIHIYIYIYIYTTLVMYCCNYIVLLPLIFVFIYDNVLFLFMRLSFTIAQEYSIIVIYQSD